MYFEKIDVKSISDIEPFWKQNWFPPLDSMSLYTILADYKPKRYLGIGFGNSTKFACRAIRNHGLDVRITSIDPHPRAEIDQISDGVIFFDGNCSFQNSDVTVFFIDILLRLKIGIIVSIHDIFCPGDRPDAWLEGLYGSRNHR